MMKNGHRTAAVRLSQFLAALALAWPLAAQSGMTPEIFKAIDPVHPGEYTAFFGADFVRESSQGNTPAQIKLVRVPDTKVSAPPAKAIRFLFPADTVTSATEQASSHSCKYRIPSTVALGIYAYEIGFPGVKNSSSIRFLNRPEVWWYDGIGRAEGKDPALAPDHIAVLPGNVISINGKNFVQTDANQAWIMNSSGTSIPLEFQALENENQVTFRVPAGTAAGKYLLYVHNGYGGDFGFSEPIDFWIAEPSVEQEASIQFTDLSSLKQFYAKAYSKPKRGRTPPNPIIVALGDGKTDDTAAFTQLFSELKKAIATQQIARAQVTLPAGTFLVSQSLTIPDRVSLTGQGMNQTEIKTVNSLPNPTPSSPPLWLKSVLSAQRDVVISKIKVTSQIAFAIFACPFASSSPPMDCRNVEVNSVDFEQQSPSKLIFSGDEGPLDPTDVPRGPGNTVDDPAKVSVGVQAYGWNFQLKDSIVNAYQARPIEVSGHHLKIDHNHFFAGHGYTKLFNIAHSTFSNNEVAGTQPDADTQVDPNRFMNATHHIQGQYGGNCIGVEGSSFQNLFSSNTVHDCHGKNGEAITFDDPYETLWTGHATTQYSKDADTTTLSVIDSWNPTVQPSPDPSTTPKPLCLDRVCTAPPAQSSPSVVTIVSGRGLGQSLPVSLNTNKSVTTLGRFSISPDSTSMFSMMADKRQTILRDNQVYRATYAIQLYSQAQDFLILGNSAHNTLGMYSMASSLNVLNNPNLKAAPRMSANYFHQWRYNTLEGLPNQDPTSYDMVPYPSTTYYKIRKKSAGVITYVDPPAGTIGKNLAALGPLGSVGSTADFSVTLVYGNVLRYNQAKEDSAIGLFGDLGAPPNLSPNENPLTLLNKTGGLTHQEYEIDSIVERNFVLCPEDPSKAIVDRVPKIDIYPGYQRTIVTDTRCIRLPRDARTPRWPPGSIIFNNSDLIGP